MATAALFRVRRAGSLKQLTIAAASLSLALVTTASAAAPREPSSERAAELDWAHRVMATTDSD
jgi:hypothetical protein